MKNKTNIELKREYWSRPEMYTTRRMVDRLIRDYGDEPASFGEAVYVLNYRSKYIVVVSLQGFMKSLDRLIKRSND